MLALLETIVGIDDLAGTPPEACLVFVLSIKVVCGDVGQLGHEHGAHTDA